MQPNKTGNQWHQHQPYFKSFFGMLKLLEQLLSKWLGIINQVEGRKCGWVLRFTLSPFLFDKKKHSVEIIMASLSEPHIIINGNTAQMWPMVSLTNTQVIIIYLCMILHSNNSMCMCLYNQETVPILPNPSLHGDLGLGTDWHLIHTVYNC